MTDVRSVNRRGWAVAITMAVVVLAGACGDDDGDAAPTTTSTRETTTTDPPATTAPPRQTSTTTTAFDPASVEGQVEAAYLRSWDVYAEAVYNLELDEPALAEVYGEASLETRRAEIASRIEDGRASLVRLDHDYEVVVVDEVTAAVVDNFVNHQVLIDPITKVPVEDDPNERLLVNFQMKSLGGTWKVTLIQKVGS